MPALLLIAGLTFLSKAADYLIEGAVALAYRFKVPTLFVGLTIIAFGTSLPEFFVNTISALRGSTEVAMGNVIGSNIANLLLILGVTALIRPPHLAHSTVWKEIPFSLFAAFILLILCNKTLLDATASSSLSRTDGVILLLGMLAFFYYLTKTALRHSVRPQAPKRKLDSLTKSTLYVAIGITGLYFGGNWTVRGATEIARSLGLSDYLISISVVAIGTSLPEMITAIKAARRGNSDLAIGNIIGANIFNIFWILGVTTLISPVTLPRGLNLDLAVLVGATLFLFFSLFIGKRHQFDRWQGGVCVASYLVYLSYTVLRG